jgi:copper chaperone CopZ
VSLRPANTDEKGQAYFRQRESNISCDECSRADVRALKTIEEVRGVDVDISTAGIPFEHDEEPITISELSQTPGQWATPSSQPIQERTPKGLRTP